MVKNGGEQYRKLFCTSSNYWGMAVKSTIARMRCKSFRNMLFSALVLLTQTPVSHFIFILTIVELEGSALSLLPRTDKMHLKL